MIINKIFRNKRANPVCSLLSNDSEIICVYYMYICVCTCMCVCRERENNKTNVISCKYLGNLGEDIVYFLRYPSNFFVILGLC